MPHTKELEFFSYTAHLTAEGIDAYLANFSAGQSAKAVGEATASYFWTETQSPWDRKPPGFEHFIPRAVHQILGADLRFIVILRDPAERALSAYGHYVAHGELPAEMPFAEAAFFNGIIDMGFYGKHFENWLAYFDRSRFLVLSLERDVRRFPEDTLHRVFDFLELSLIDGLLIDVDARVFPGTNRRLLKTGAVRYEAPADHSERLVPRNSIGPAELAALKALYKTDVHKLDDLTGLEFSTLWEFG